MKSDESAFVLIKISRGTCYGSPALSIEMKFSDGEKITCEVSEGLKSEAFLVERADVEKLLSEIVEIVEKPEKLADLRHVEVRYHVEIEWKNFDFLGNEKSGKFEVFSNEWLTDEIEEFINYEAETPEIAERFQKILDAKPHRHALEIYRTVKDFRRKYLM